MSGMYGSYTMPPGADAFEKCKACCYQKYTGNGVLGLNRFTYKDARRPMILIWAKNTGSIAAFCSDAPNGGNLTFYNSMTAGFATVNALFVGTEYDDCKAAHDFFIREIIGKLVLAWKRILGKLGEGISLALTPGTHTFVISNHQSIPTSNRQRHLGSMMPFLDTID